MKEIPGRRFVNIADDVKLGKNVTMGGGPLKRK